MLLLVLTACRSGFIRYATGSDDLRAAYYVTVADPTYASLSQTVVLLANSDIDCNHLPTVADKADADPVTDAAFTRENARVVVLYLYQRLGSSIVDHYDLDESQSGENVTTDHGVAAAAYLGVNEAVLTDEDGIERFYLPGSNPGDCELVPHVPSPGAVDITRADDHLKGTFSLDAIDVSGRFDALECTSNPDFATAFQAISLLEDDLSSCVYDDPSTP
jgi:hypothetical protein